MKKLTQIMGLGLLFSMLSIALFSCGGGTPATPKTIAELSALVLSTEEGKTALTAALKAGAEAEAVKGLAAGTYAMGIKAYAATTDGTAASGYIIAGLPTSHAEMATKTYSTFEIPAAIYGEAEQETIVAKTLATGATPEAATFTVKAGVTQWGVVLLEEKATLVTATTTEEKTTWVKVGEIKFTAKTSTVAAKLTIGTKEYTMVPAEAAKLIK